MSTATQPAFVKDAWQTPRNARTLRAFMALQNQEIADRLKELRKAKGNPPQTDVAEAIGAAERTYQSWEQADAKPSYRFLQKLAAYYEVGEEYILAGTAAQTPDIMSELDGDRLARIEQRLSQLEISVDRQNENLDRQSEILERIESIAAGIPTPEELAAQAEAIAREHAAERKRAAKRKPATGS